MALLKSSNPLGERSGVVFCALLSLITIVTLALREHPAPSEERTGVLSATATIEPQKTFQVWLGFGASAAFYQDWLLAHPERHAIYQALFGELRLNLLRLRNTYEPGRGELALAEQDLVIGATRARGERPKLILTSWSPPGYLKSTGKTRNGGTLARTAQGYNYAGFADWWHDSVLAYRLVGLHPDYVSIQNEPDWKADWETCLFKPEESAEFASYPIALKTVRSAVGKLPSPPRFLGPDTLSVGNPQAFLTGESAALVEGIAHHLYGGAEKTQPDSYQEPMRALKAQFSDKPLFQTEFGEGDGVRTAWLIHNSITEEGVSAYLYWASVWPGADALVRIENPWRRTDWKIPQGFERTDRFFALAHYSRFIQPGYLRVAAQASEPDLRLCAFLRPDRSQLVAVCLNVSEDRTLALPLSVPGYRVQDAYRTDESAGEHLKSLAARGLGKVVIPPRSLVTWVLTQQ